MQKVKFFKGIENELLDLEAEINGWIEATGCRIISITGNIAPQTANGQTLETFASSDVLVVVMYEAAHG